MLQRFVVVTIAAVVVCGCGGGGGSTSASTTPTAPTTGPGSAAVVVAIVGSSGNQAFNPNPVTASAGESLTFSNHDTTEHHIVLDDGSVDLGVLAPGTTSRAVNITSTAAVTYHCLIHPSMVGSINGQTAPEPPPCSDPLGYGCE
ncbi:MAG: cupredoxin domain-containing protein [Vicinamibacterales bacterium]